MQFKPSTLRLNCMFRGTGQDPWARGFCTQCTVAGRLWQWGRPRQRPGSLGSSVTPPADAGRTATP